MIVLGLGLAVGCGSAEPVGGGAGGAGAGCEPSGATTICGEEGIGTEPIARPEAEVGSVAEGASGVEPGSSGAADGEARAEPRAVAGAAPARAPRAALPGGPWTEELVLDHAAYPIARAPSVVVHAPPTFHPARPLRLVIFLHGWTGCARQLVTFGEVACRDGDRPREGWALAARFDEGGSDALLVVPQLAFLRRDGRPGRFGEPGHFRSFLNEMLARLHGRLGDVDLSDVESISLLAHSAGFETALAVLHRGAVDELVRHVVLFDALYRGVGPFSAWVAADPAGRRLVSIHTGSGRTASQSRMLVARASRVAELEVVSRDTEEGLADLVAAHAVVVARSTAPHSRVPARHMPELLPALGLGSRTPAGVGHDAETSADD